MITFKYDFDPAHPSIIALQDKAHRAGLHLHRYQTNKTRGRRRVTYGASKSVTKPRLSSDCDYAVTIQDFNDRAPSLRRVVALTNTIEVTS